MMNKQEFKNLAKRILKFQRGIQDTEIIHPARDWFVGLVVAIIIFAGSGAWSARVYFNHQNSVVSNADEASEDVVVYRESLVAAALEYFGNKEEFYTNLIDSKATPNIEVSVELPVIEETELATSSSEASATSTIESSATEETVQPGGETDKGVVEETQSAPSEAPAEAGEPVTPELAY